MAFTNNEAVSIVIFGASGLSVIGAGSANEGHPSCRSACSYSSLIPYQKLIWIVYCKIEVTQERITQEPIHTNTAKQRHHHNFRI